MTVFAATEDVFENWDIKARWWDVYEKKAWRHEAERVIWRVRFAEAALYEADKVFQERRPLMDTLYEMSALDRAFQRYRSARVDYARVMDPANVCRLLDEALDRR